MIKEATTEFEKAIALSTAILYMCQPGPRLPIGGNKVEAMKCVLN